MASSSSMVLKYEKPRSWSELPPELTSSIMLLLDAFDILENAQMVCREWRLVSKDPSLWRIIDMQNCQYLGDQMCCNAIDRSQGGLVKINIGNIGTDSLLTYIADRSPNLRSLGLEVLYPLTNKGLVNALSKLPLLEELEVPVTWSKLDLKAICYSCPKLKTLKINFSRYNLSWFKSDDDDALEIAKYMLELRHLQLIGNRLTNTGLTTILDNCPHLEHLDLRQCLNIDLLGELEKRCLEKITYFRRPNDSSDDYPFYATFVDMEDDYLDYTWC